MQSSRRSKITVGVDDSPSSRIAARWAAREATRRQLPLELVLSVTDPWRGHSDDLFPPQLIATLRETGSRKLDSAAGEIRRRYPTVEVRTTLTHDDPRQALLSASTDATLTVVGTRGRGRVPEVVLGSVALFVASHAHSPVAVVPPTTDVADDRPTGPILLGVDGSGGSESAVAFAFAEADVCRTDLLAITVWSDLTFLRPGHTASDTQQVAAEQAGLVLAEQLAGWTDKYPDVAVHEVVLRGRPADRMLGYAEGLARAERPRIMVVGGRGRGPLAGLLLGSTGQLLIANALVPVVVVRQEAADHD